MSITTNKELRYAHWDLYFFRTAHRREMYIFFACRTGFVPDFRAVGPKNAVIDTLGAEQTLLCPLLFASNSREHTA
jgi:hypothetical protein